MALMVVVPVARMVSEAVMVMIAMRMAVVVMVVMVMVMMKAVLVMMIVMVLMITLMMMVAMVMMVVMVAGITQAIPMIILTIICSGHSRIRRFNSPLGLLVQKAFLRITGRASGQPDDTASRLAAFLNRLTTLKVTMPKLWTDSLTGHPLVSWPL